MNTLLTCGATLMIRASQLRILAILLLSSATALLPSLALAQGKSEALVKVARTFLDAVDSGEERRAISLMYPGTPDAPRLRHIEMRLVRGKLSNTRITFFKGNDRNPEGYPYKMILESDAEHDVIYAGVIRKTTVADITIHVHNGVPMVSQLYVPY
jgi:hypothetical protein